MKNYNIGCLFFLFMLTCVRTYAQDPNFHIYLCLGQSNMGGSARFETQDTISVNNRFQVLQAVDCVELNRKKGNWYVAKPPLCRCNTGLSPADYFGRTMITRLPEQVKVGVINVAVGGAKIELFNKDTYQSYSATAPQWMTGMINQYDGNPYGRLVELAKMAQKDGVIKGILLHQGESNAGDTLWTKKIKLVYEVLKLKLAPFAKDGSVT